MRDRSSSKQGRVHKVEGSMELDTVDEAKEPQLSGAYIRSLVKHLSASARTKDSLDGDGGSVKSQNQNWECFSDVTSSQQPPPPTQPPPPPQHKKQVRRRLHTTKPYQERLLNMAEARREIVTALKFHRASMKQQEGPQTHPQLDQSPPPPPPPPPPPSLGKSKSRRNPRLSPATATATTVNLPNYFIDPYSSLACPHPSPYYWPISTIAPPPPPHYHEDPNFALPNQTLGLNLNFQNFNNLDTNIYHNPISLPSSSSTSSSSSAAISAATEETAMVKPKEVVVNGNGLHHAMGDSEMEELRSLGEQHQMEWNDTVNLVTSARWCKFLNTMETGKSCGFEEDLCDGSRDFEPAMEFPSWLMNANEASGLQQHFPDSYLQDPSLPRMEIGEIEGIDGEWLA